MDELRKMAICDLEDIIGASEFTKADQEWVWPIKRDAFERFKVG